MSPVTTAWSNSSSKCWNFTSVSPRRSPSDRDLYQRQTARPAVSGVDATDREIDRLVYELYGLTEEEIAVVEEKR